LKSSKNTGVVTAIGAEVVTAPRSSMAFAVKTYEPDATLFKVIEYGEVLSVPIRLVPW